MRLSELMSNFGLSSYAEVGLVLFFMVFLVVMFRVFNPKYQAEYQAASCMPLDDDVIRTPLNGSSGQDTELPTPAAGEQS